MGVKVSKKDEIIKKSIFADSNLFMKLRLIQYSFTISNIEKIFTHFNIINGFYSEQLR